MDTPGKAPLARLALALLLAALSVSALKLGAEGPQAAHGQTADGEISLDCGNGPGVNCSIPLDPAANAFTVYISVDSFPAGPPAGYRGWQAFVSWDATVLDYSEASPGAEVTWPDSGFPAGLTEQNDLNDPHDSRNIGSAIGVDVQPSQFTGRVANLQFRCESEGTTTLDLAPLDVNHTNFQDANEQAVTRLPAVRTVVVTCVAPAEGAVTEPTPAPTAPSEAEQPVTAPGAPEAAPSPVTGTAPTTEFPPTGSGPSGGSSNAPIAVLAAVAALGMAAGLWGLIWTRRQQRWG